MAESIHDVKRRLRAAYLGKAGIHALGINHAQQAIRVYLTPGDAPGLAATLAELRESARPFAVTIVVEEPPKMA